MPLRLGIEEIWHRTADRFGLTDSIPMEGPHVRVMGRRRAYDAGTPLTGFPDMDAPLPPMSAPISETEPETETVAEPRASRVHRPVALVTGSTSGIGAAIARRLAADGYAVILHSRRSADVGRAMARELGGAYVQADLADDAERVRLIREAVAVHGRLDVLVNNAGVSRVIPHDDLAAATPDVWREMHEINVIAPFRLVAEAEAALREAASHGRAGCVVNVSSHAGVRPKGASIPYAAAKAALNHTTRLLAKTLAPAIRVNAVAPGPSIRRSRLIGPTRSSSGASARRCAARRRRTTSRRRSRCSSRPTM